MVFRRLQGSEFARRMVCCVALMVFVAAPFAGAQQQDQEGARGPSDAYPDVLLSHTIGKEGVPFPKPEQFKWPPAVGVDEEAGAVPTKVPAPTPTPYQQPKRCSKNETKRVVYKDKESETTLLTDDLFIPEELVPLEPQEVFGSDVSLIPYGPEAGKAAEIRMEVNEVPCLPYRKRLTNTTWYFDTGINALKNYDGAPGGSGKLHPLMQQKLYPNNRGAVSNRPPPRR